MGDARAYSYRVRPPGSSGSSWPFRVWLIDSMICRKGATLGHIESLASLRRGPMTNLSTAAQAKPGPTEPPKCCTLLYGEAGPGELSPLLAEACSDVSTENVRGRMGALLKNAAASESAGETPSVAASTRLMLWSGHQYHQGSMTEILGSAGDCDYSGHRIPVSGWWSSNISSIQLQREQRTAR